MDDVMISDPVIKSPITGGSGMITGIGYSKRGFGSFNRFKIRFIGSAIEI